MTNCHPSWILRGSGAVLIWTISNWRWHQIRLGTGRRVRNWGNISSRSVSCVEDFTQLAWLEFIKTSDRVIGCLLMPTSLGSCSLRTRWLHWSRLLRSVQRGLGRQQHRLKYWQWYAIDLWSRRGQWIGWSRDGTTRRVNQGIGLTWSIWLEFLKNNSLRCIQIEKSFSVSIFLEIFNAFGSKKQW